METFKVYEQFSTWNLMLFETENKILLLYAKGNQVLDAKNLHWTHSSSDYLHKRFV